MPANPQRVGARGLPKTAVLCLALSMAVPALTHAETAITDQVWSAYVLKWATLVYSDGRQETAVVQFYDAARVGLGDPSGRTKVVERAEVVGLYPPAQAPAASAPRRTVNPSAPPVLERVRFEATDPELRSEVSMDGGSTYTVPCELQAAAGAHLLTVTKSGRSSTANIQVPPGGATVRIFGHGLVLVPGPAAQEQPCEPGRMGNLLLDLFPPATEVQRRDAIRELARCKVKQAAPLIGVVAERDPEPSLQLVAVEALGQIGGTPQLRSLARAPEGPAHSSLVRIWALAILAKSGDVEVARAIADDAREDAEVRAAAARHLELAALRTPERKPESIQPAAVDAVAAPTAPVALSPAAEPAPVAQPESAPADRQPRASDLPVAALQVAPQATENLRATLPESGTTQAEPPAPQPATTLPGPTVAQAPEEPKPEPTPPAALAEPEAESELKSTAQSAPVSEAPAAPEKESPIDIEDALTAGPAEPGLDIAPRKVLSGVPLSIATNTLAGSTLMVSLTLMAQQEDKGVLALVGTAGAVIGGGAAWGLWRLGFKPDLSQALWYTNSTVWGTLAGAALGETLGRSEPRARWGLLAGGEVVGIGVGILTASKLKWTPGQTVLANSLVLGLGLTDMGFASMLGERSPFSDRLAYGLLPAMVASAAASRFVELSTNDLHFMGVTALTAGWNGSLIAAGATRDPLLGSTRSAGGLAAGLGIGYLGAVALSVATDLEVGRSYAMGGGALVGNLLGLGVGMMATPGDSARWGLGAGLGGLGLGVATALAYPVLKVDRDAMALGPYATLWGAGTVLLAGLATGGESSNPDDRTLLFGSALTAGVVGGLTGVLLSPVVEPQAADIALGFTGVGMGLSAGLGLGMLSGPQGVPDMIGVMAGSAVGLASSALAAHYLRLRPPDVLAAAVGTTYGAMWGALLPSVGGAEWASGRSTGGGVLLAMPAVALGAIVASHAAEATAAEVSVPTFAGLMGTGLGLGAGLAWPSDDLQAARIGAIAGSAGMIALSLALDRPLRLHEGFAAKDAPLALAGVIAGAAEGMLVAAAADASGVLEKTPPRQVLGGALMGASAGLISGLLFSRAVDPGAPEFALGASGWLMGTSAGLGLSMLAAQPGPADTWGLLAGSVGGLATAAVASHFVRLRPPDVLALGAGTAYGALWGGLLPTLFDAHWDPSAGRERQAVGGALLGAPVVALAGATLSHLIDADASEVAVPTVAGLTGLGMGLGLGLAWPGESMQPARIGAVAGSLSLVLASAALEQPLRLNEPYGLHAVPLALVGAANGLGAGMLVAGMADPTGLIARTPGRQLAGGALLGASAGVASGLVLSHFIQPTAEEYALSLGTTTLGALLGAGIPLLAFQESGRADLAGILAGSAVGLVGGALLADDVTGPDVAGAFAGISWGAVLGALAPTLAEPRWDGGRRGVGGAFVGLSLGGFGVALATHYSGASAGQVAVPALGALAGLGMGLGAGMMVPTGQTQPERLGAFIGIPVMAAVSLLLDCALHFSSEGMPLQAVGLASFNAAMGAGYGLLLAGAISPRPTADPWSGGVLLGTSAGIASGLVLSKLIDFTGSDAASVSALTGLGAGLGLGVALLAWQQGGSGDYSLTFAGAALGTTAGALVQHFTPLEGADAAAIPVGLGYGALLGALAPSLAGSDWPTADRRTAGFTLLGASTGAIALTAIRHATGIPAEGMGLITLGGIDGAAAGLGLGLLVDPKGSQAMRIGLTAGIVGGLALGSAVWPQVTLGEGDRPFIAVGTTVGAWTGQFLPLVLESRWERADAARVAGGLLAGTGLAIAATTSLAPFVEIPADASVNALALDALFSAGGLGVGLLATDHDGYATAAMLGAGTLGLVLGGALHEKIEVQRETMPLLTWAPLHGLWYGAWLPFLIRDSKKVEARHVAGGLVAGGLGGLGIAAVTSTFGRPSWRTMGLAGIGSAIGAAAGGGAALFTPEAGSQGQAAMLMGGSALGLLGGALLAPRLDYGGGAGAGIAALGTVLGASEGLVFAWAGHATKTQDWAGAALIGAGAGAAMGMAAAAARTQLDDRATGIALASGGFAAWGAWMGAFGGSLANRDAHEVTTGGLIGMNVGAAVGCTLLVTDVVKPAEFGWLSLFGAGGTVVGAGVGAAFSSKNDPAPVLAGLAIGPAVGIAAGAIALPKLRPMLPNAKQPAPALGPGGDGAKEDVKASMPRQAPAGSSALSQGLRGLGEVVKVADWMPLVGTMPAPGNGGSSLVIGVHGRTW
ncbi:MAG: hypothetical protein QM765_30040 [Myxococcales bacterium]